MSNKKLSRLLEPNLKFYFFFMLLFVVVAVPVNWKLALAEAAVTALFDRIAASEAPWQEIRVVPELVVKKTTAPPRRR